MQDQLQAKNNDPKTQFSSLVPNELTKMAEEKIAVFISLQNEIEHDFE